jgi:hypothetical protein
VDQEEHAHGVTGPFGRLGDWDTGVDPAGGGCVPQVVRPAASGDA